MLVDGRGKFLVKRLLFFQARDEDFEELFQGSHCQILSTIVINGHLFDLGVLFDQLSLLRLQRRLPRALPLLRSQLLRLLLLIGASGCRAAVSLGV